MPYLDEALAALIADIHERGLERRILVVVVGEFGRTPNFRTGPPDNSVGRDHWPQAYSALVSGGGVKGGTAVGATDARGAYPKERPLSPQDLLATVYHHLGINTEQQYVNGSGRPVSVLPSGEPIEELF